MKNQSVRSYFMKWTVQGYPGRLMCMLRTPVKKETPKYLLLMESDIWYICFEESNVIVGENENFIVYTYI